MFREFVQDVIVQLSEVNLFLQHLGVFVISFIPFVESPGGAIAGSLIGIMVILAALLGIIGNWISMMMIILPFNALLTKIRNRQSKQEGFIQNRVSKAKARYDKYGVPGLALIAPLFVSTHISAFTSLAVGANKTRVIYWHTFSIIVWGIIGAVIGSYIHSEIIF